MDFPCPFFFCTNHFEIANVIATVPVQQSVDICIIKIILIKIQMSKVEVTALCDCNCNGYQATNHSVCNSKDVQVKATMIMISSLLSNSASRTRWWYEPRPPWTAEHATVWIKRESSACVTRYDHAYDQHHQHLQHHPHHHRQCLCDEVIMINTINIILIIIIGLCDEV